MKIKASDFLKAIELITSSIRYGTEVDKELEVTLSDEKVENIVQAMTIVLTSKQKKEAYKPEQSITRTLEIFAANENTSPVLTSMSKQVLNEDD